MLRKLRYASSISHLALADGYSQGLWHPGTLSSFALGKKKHLGFGDLRCLLWDAFGLCEIMCPRDIVIVAFLLLEQNTWYTQFKIWEVDSGLWFQRHQFRVSGLCCFRHVARQKHCDKWAGWRKAAHLMVAKKQREQKSHWEEELGIGHALWRYGLPVTYFLQLGPTY